VDTTVANVQVSPRRCIFSRHHPPSTSLAFAAATYYSGMGRKRSG
jgi:hypothetical protein